MKTSVLLILICLLTGGSIAMAVYTYRQPVTTEVAVLSDVTDMRVAPLNAASLLVLYNLQGDNNWNGATFRYADITDVSYNSTETAAIPAANKWLSNELDRDKAVTAFETQVASILSGNATSGAGKPRSSVYLAIANQLTQLSQSAANRRVLIVSSDLMENQPGFSFYDKKLLHEVQTDPEAIAKQLQQWQSLPDLKGIAVYLIYQPANSAEDEQYRIVSGFYQTLLQSKGATVTIQANLSN